jgi:hypothetical protein
MRYSACLNKLINESGMGTNKNHHFENIKVQTLILRHGKENTDKVVFHQIKSSMQVQKYQ